MNTKTKKLILLVVIILAYGAATYNYLNPPIVSLDKEDQVKIENVVTTLCPKNIPVYYNALQEDGTILLEDANKIIDLCTEEFESKPSTTYESAIQGILNQN